MDEVLDSQDDESLLDPQQLALAYDRLIAARWRGDDAAADTCAKWFEAHWVFQAPPEPEDPPGAASVLGGSGHGIRWYARDRYILGYVTGRAGGCYRVAAQDAIPVVTAPWEILSSPHLSADGSPGASP
jgi:hypothetical protein